MLLPALSKAREKARLISCVNNMKQLGLASTMYTEDYAETLVYHMIVQYGTYGRWFHALDAYEPMIDKSYGWTAGNYSGVLLKTLECGSDTYFNVTHKTGVSNTNGGDNSSYGIHQQGAGMALAIVKNPSVKIMFMENCHKAEGIIDNNNYASYVSWYGQGFTGRHNEAGNIVMIDGHVETAGKTKIEEIKNASNRDIYFNVDK